MLVGCPYAYVQGCGVGLVVEGAGRSEGAVGIDRQVSLPSLEGVSVVCPQVDPQSGALLEVAVERDGFDTVGGYLLTRLGRVPSAGETVEVDELTVEVLEAERRRVRRVRVRLNDGMEAMAR